MPKKKKPGISSRKEFFWSQILQGDESAFAGLVITQRDGRKETIWQAIAQASWLSPGALCYIETQMKKRANRVDALNSKLQGKGESALGLAITMDNYQSALLLLHMGADIHTAFADESLWLHRVLSCMAKADEISEMLQILCEKTNFSELYNQQDSHQSCVYEYALVKHESRDLCERFLRMGLAPAFLIQGQPLVLWLVTNGKQDWLEIFLPYLSKEQVYTSANKGSNILFKACAEGDIDLVKILLKIHPHPHYVGECKQNALHVLANIAKESVTVGHKAVFDLLLEIGVDCSHVNSRGNTPLMEMMINGSHQEWINQLILVSNLYQINRDDEHCLNMAIRQGLADAALVILGMTKGMASGPFALESKVCPLPDSFLKSLDRELKEKRAKRLLTKLPESASPASVALMSYLLYGDKMTKVIRELICFRGYEIEWHDDPYQALLSVGSFRLVGILLKHGVPIKKNKELIDQCMENVSPGYSSLINQVNQEITAGRMGKALNIAKSIQLELFPITWACYPDFLEYILLSFLEYHYLQLSFETLYQIIKRDKLSQYLELDNYYDHACNSVGVNFVSELQHFLARLEQKKINDRCHEGSRRQLISLGFVLTPGEALPILEPSKNDIEQYRNLIHACDVKSVRGYREAKEYWTQTLSIDLGDFSELKSEGLSFVELFLRRFEYDHFEKRLKATLKDPQGMLTAFSVLASSPNPGLRKETMIAVNKQITNNTPHERGGFLANLLGGGRGSDIADENFLVEEVLRGTLSGDEILAVATKVLNSLRMNNGGRTVTNKPQKFFEVIAKTILSPRGMFQDVGLLATWLDACAEQAIWLQSPEVRIQILHYLSVRYKNSADRVIEVLERILQYIGHEVFDIPMSGVGSVESILAARAEGSVQSYQGDQRDYVLDRSNIILFLCQPQILRLVKKGNQQLYLRLQTYTACEVIACNRRSIRVIGGQSRTLEDASKSIEVASFLEKLRLENRGLQVGKNTLEEQNIKSEALGNKLREENRRLQVEKNTLEEQNIKSEALGNKLREENRRLQVEKADLERQAGILRVRLSGQERSPKKRSHENRLPRNGWQGGAVVASNNSTGSLGIFAPNAHNDGKPKQGPGVHPRRRLGATTADASGRADRLKGSGYDVDGRGYVVSQSGSGGDFACRGPQGDHDSQPMLASQANQGSMSSILGWSGRIASMLYRFDPDAQIYLGGSLALLLARGHERQQTLWVQAADMGCEDIDMSIVTRHSGEEIQGMLMSGFSGVRGGRVMVSLDRKCGSVRINITGEMIYRVEIRINRQYIPYPDAINWAWSQCLGYHVYSDWVFDVSKIYWYQYQFIDGSAWLDGVPGGCQYSFFWGVFQLIKHRYYMGGSQLQACHSGMISGYKKIQSQVDEVANAVLEIIQVFSGTLFWKSCLQVLLGYEVEKSANGMPYMLIYSLLPKGAVASGFCIDGAEDLVSMETKDKLLEWIKDQYTKRCGAGLLAHKGPVVWADVAGKDVGTEVNIDREGMGTLATKSLGR